MTTQPLNSQFDAVTPAKMNALGLAFFMMGAPHIYGAMKQRRDRQSQSSAFPYWNLVCLAIALAAVLELAVS
ncbi:MAG: hypothetical protein ACKO63_19450 [Nodosilinea sp.]